MRERETLDHAGAVEVTRGWGKRMEDFLVGVPNHKIYPMTDWWRSRNAINTLERIFIFTHLQTVSAASSDPPIHAPSE